jgi:hypothetical protein
LRTARASARTSRQIAKLIEHEQRMVTGAGIVTVPGTHLLFAMRRAHARIHVEHYASRRTASMNKINPLTGKISKSGKVISSRQPLRLEATQLAR